MQKTFRFNLAQVILICSTFASCLSAAPSGTDWVLKWSDEFNDSGLPDTTKWAYDVGKFNDELQYYTKARKENAHCENGNLVIEAIKEPYQGFNYTSAQITTRGKAQWTYGRVEVRAKIPAGKGVWPAIWMIGTLKKIWPDEGEIDIMENVWSLFGQVEGSIHTNSINADKNYPLPSATYYDNYYTYAIEWNSDTISFFVDDAKYFTFLNDHTGWQAWPFSAPAYLILNLAIGGSWGGAVDTTIFPTKFYVDYVRVYQKDAVSTVRHSNSPVKSTAVQASKLDLYYDLLGKSGRGANPRGVSPIVKNNGNGPNKTLQ